MKKDKVLIVESPTKARTLSSFLKDIRIYSSVGHIRDLPKKEMGVDVAKNFEPTYVVPKEKKKVVQQLKHAIKSSGEVYLATDPDREGEAIAWHLQQVLSLPSAKRIVFHEITRGAVSDALAHPREIDNDLVEAQQARRLLDRLVGFSISPLLWRKVKGIKGLSAGRVQSIALRLIVEREKEIEDFKVEEYWSVHAFFQEGEIDWVANLTKKDGQAISLAKEEEAQAVITDCQHRPFEIVDLQKKKRKRMPPLPFRTSTLQQDAYRRFGFSAARTMRVAQQLYEGMEVGEGSVGLITYMRTDSTDLAAEAIARGKKQVAKMYGEEFVGTERRKKKKVRGAQEAHEAIRPTNFSVHPSQLEGKLSEDAFRLYDLIYRRALASLMKPAEDEQTKVLLQCGSFLFQANGLRHLFPGFRAALSGESKEQFLPKLEKGQQLQPVKIEPKQHFTQPPPRYTEASLVKVLEEKGIGRPSTYAPTLETVKKRSYVVTEERSLKPTELGKTVCQLLVQHFPKIMDIDFTAKMESDLDRIESGQRAWRDLLQGFYTPFQTTVEKAQKNMETVKVALEETDQKCDQCGKPMVIRYGRYGRFLSCSGFPECKTAKPLTTDVACPKEGCNGKLVRRRGKGKGKGKATFFYGCSNYPTCTYTTRFLPRTRKSHAAS